MYWRALNREEINNTINQALEQNASYEKGDVIGTPATYLDKNEFYPDASFLKDAPFLRSLIANPNHIGCHTLEKVSSPIFKGTQAIEKELIEICSEEIFKAPKSAIDGYIATGGTEANIEALWIYRNYFIREYGAKAEQVGVLFSEDTHYSITKGCNLLQITPVLLNVDNKTREIELENLAENIAIAMDKGIKYFIVVLNVSTTMFGSVDDIDSVVNILDREEIVFKVHLDAAFGGFIYPFTNKDSKHNFKHPRVSSISIDAHKMLQTPYGTGMFLIRKGYMQYVTNNYAQYVPGLDYTLCGSRSGANAIVIWMLLKAYGSEGWTNKMNELNKRTDFLCNKLDQLEVEYFRNPFINIVAIKANEINTELAKKYELVADTYEHTPSWWKIVVMDHVSYQILENFIAEFESYKLAKAI